MCGICGVVHKEPEAPVREELLHRMAAAIAHRGPDGQGVVALGPAGLASRRLAIVDRTSAGAQPMCSEDRTLWIVYNGEIYNYMDERRALEARGYRFRSRSDTEVLLYLYQEYGEACLTRLNGMFACAIWNGRTRELFLARDRFGKKPLYYQATDDRFIFASEIKALLAAQTTTPAVDPEALHHFLSFDYVPSPRTAFHGIHKLPAGHQLLYRNGTVRVSRYFSQSYAVRSPVPTPDDAARELRARLRTAVGARLMGEVPVGVFLSGGIDSASIVALLAGEGRVKVPTFSIAFREASHDESRYARLIARQFATEHHEFVVGPDLASELPGIVRHYDEPFGDPSVLPTWFLAREARQHITVALTGDGGDEAFAGYQRYIKNALAARYLRLPRVLRRATGATLGRIVPKRLRFEHPLRQLARFAALDVPSVEALYCRWLLHFDAEQKQDLYTADFRGRVQQESCGLVQTLLAGNDGRELLARELATDVASYLPDDLLVKTDMATMAHSMEARCPFLDPDVMALAASLPSTYKLRGMRTKWILKRALRGLLPDETIHRPKQGFGPPIDRWLRRELRPLLHETLLARRAIERGYFNADVVRRMIDEHESGVRGWPFHLWNLLVLELWHLEVVDARRPATG